MGLYLRFIKNVLNTEAVTTLFKYFHWQRFSKNTGTVN
jgi:hypothetical protein